MASIAILNLFGFDFFADILGRTADHQSCDENRKNDEKQHAVHTGADTADNDFTKLNVDEGNHATERCERIVHGVDGAAGRGGCDNCEQRGGGDAEAGFLSYMLPPVRPRA